MPGKYTNGSDRYVDTLGHDSFLRRQHYLTIEIFGVFNVITPQYIESVKKIIRPNKHFEKSGKTSSNSRNRIKNYGKSMSQCKTYNNQILQ